MSFTVGLDDSYLEVEQTFEVTVQGTDDAPVPVTATAAASEDNVLNGTLQADDVDSPNPTFSLAEGPAQGQVSIAADGSFSFDPNGDFEALDTGETTTVTFTYAVSDATTSVEQQVTVTISGANDGPVPQTASIAAVEDGSVEGTLIATDADDTDLTFTLVTPPTKGTLTVDADGSYSFDPGQAFQDLDAGATETLSFVYSVGDGEATALKTATLTVTGSNDGPVAVSDVATTTENAGIIVDVLSNDTDADANAVLSLSSVDVTDGLGIASILDGQMSYDPGTVYDHLAVGETATVTIAYTMADEQGAESASTVTVTVTGSNDGPLAAVDNGRNGSEQCRLDRCSGQRHGYRQRRRPQPGCGRGFLRSGNGGGRQWSGFL